MSGQSKDRDPVISEALLTAREIGAEAGRTFEPTCVRPAPECERLFRFLDADVPLCLAYADSDRRYRFANATYEKWFGISVRDILGKRVEDVIGSEAYEIVRVFVDRALAGERVSYEVTVPYQGAGERTIHGELVPDADPQGNVLGYYLAIQDVTEQRAAEAEIRHLNELLQERVRQRTEELRHAGKLLDRERRLREAAVDALRESREFFEMVFDTVAEGVVVQDEFSRIVSINPAAERLLGMSRHLLVGRKVGDIPWHAVGEDGRTYSEEEFPWVRSFATGEPVSGEIMGFPRSSGCVSWTYVSTRPLFREGEDRPRSVVVSFSDISRLKETEEELRRGENRYRTLVAHLADTAVHLFDTDLKLLIVGGEELTNLGLNRADIEGKPLSEAYPGAISEFMEPYYRKALAGEPSFFEHEWEGHVYEQQVIPLRDDDGIVQAGLVVSRNVTEQRRSQERIEKSLREKEVLLREIHHRVKNNLAVVNSLLSLQTHHAEGDEQRRILEAAQDRIRSMALAHSKLYESDNLADLDLKAYLDGLLQHLMHSHTSLGVPVRLYTDIAPMQLTLDTAVPVGFIVTELFSNCLKHAFVGHAEGSVGVAVTPTGDGGFVLSVKDDGVGIPETVDPDYPATLGLELVGSLVEQLHGRMEIIGDNGTEIKVHVPSHPDPCP